MIEQLKNSYLVVPIAIVLTVAIIFLTSKITSEHYSKTTYILLTMYVATIASIIVYINIDGVSLDTEPILKGPPPF